MSIDYQAELKNVDEFSGDYWKPKAGQYSVTALGEIEEAEPAIFGDKPDAKPQARMELKIKVKDKEFIWNFPKGKKGTSTYGQLLKLAVAKGNKLTNVVFTIVVVGEGQDIRYTIVI